MSKSAKDASHDPISLHEQLDRLTAALREVAKAESAEAIETASDAARRIAEELAEKADAVAAATSKGRGQLEQAIRDQPLTAVALAAAAGFLVALLVRR
jgi:ElaB/YqjD/DUF883 family membrane-anchored ribosome-binding protein